MRKSTMRILLILTSACLMLFVLMAAAPSTMGYITKTGAAAGFSSAAQGEISISFNLPKGWYTRREARVGIAVIDAHEIGILKVEAKSVQNGNWMDVTDTLYLDISENCTVYIQVTDYTGAVTAKSVYVECFDRERPTVRASRSGRLLRVEAKDDLSGVAAIFVDGEEYTDLVDGTLEVRLNSRDNEDEKIWIQAKDNAGNLSTTYSMTNPYYVDPNEKKDASSTSSQECEKEKSSGNSTIASQPDGGTATVTPAPASASATTTDSASSGSATASEEITEGGNKGIPGGVIAVGEKQFIAIETRDGEIFYLIIDGERESDNVYLVTEATTQDLQSFTRDEAGQDDSGGSASDSNGGTSDTASVNGTPNPDADTGTLIDGGILPGKDDSPEDDGLLDIDGDNNSSGAGEESSSGEASSDTSGTDAAGKKGNPIPGWIVIIILLFIAAFAGYMFLVVLPRKKATEAYLEDEDEYMEEPYDVEPGEASEDSGESPTDGFTEDREDDIFNVGDEE